MKSFKYLAVVGLLFICTISIAQDQSVDYSKQYTGAQLLFSQGNYNLAMEAFKPLIQADENNPYSSYASFYYAISAYREGYLPMAKNMFLQIKQVYPKWSKLTEVNFWLAHIYFENKEYNSALNVLKSIEDKKQQDFIKDLKKYHISGIEDLTVLKSLYEFNDSDELVGQILAERIAKKPLASRDQQLLEDLINKFDLDAEQLNVSHVTQSIFKDEYKVAVLLPFMVDNLEPVDKRKVNQFVIDVYEGMKLAVDSLRNSGVNVKLFAYDTRRDSVTTSRLLEKEEMKGMDAIVGPLFPKPIELVKEFAYANKINAVNPFFTNSEIIGNNPFSFLYKPSSEKVGAQAAEYVSGVARNKVGIIFYGDQKQDSVLAHAYKARIEKDSFNIIINKKIEKDSSRCILDLLLISNQKIKEASTEEARENYDIALDSIGHIFVASKNDLISTKVISAVETRGDSIMVVGSAEWLELPAINYETYLRLGVKLYAPSYMPKDTLGFDNFRKRYVKRHKMSPTDFSSDGFELMMLLGTSLKEYGKYFQLGWSEAGYIPGFISYGYNYSYSNSNQVVPILSFEDDQVKVILNREISDGDKEQ